MNKIDVYLINGFLGSGKTSTLIQFMEYFKKKNKKYAIILNELGNANVEKHLFTDESLFELLNGCICCSIKEDLTTTLDELIEKVKREKIEVVLVEGTGVANPAEILDVFQEEKYAIHFRIKESVCVIDSIHLAEYTSIFSSSKEVRALQKEQIERGSILVLNKLDQLIGKEDIDKVEKIVRKYNKTAPIIHSTYGSGVTKSIEANLTSIPTKVKSDYHHHIHLNAVKIELLESITPSLVQNYIEQNESKIYRAKGIVHFQKKKEWYHFQYASGRFKWEPLKKVSKNQKGELVLIGEKLTVEEIKI